MANLNEWGLNPTYEDRCNHQGESVFDNQPNPYDPQPKEEKMAGYRGPSSVFNPYDPLKESENKMAIYNPDDLKATAPRSSSIRDNRDNAHHEIEKLFANIQDLKEVLEPLLVEEPNEKRGSDPVAPASSSLGSSFYEIANRVKHANEQLIELRHRIDL